ncbi:MAG: alpha-ribazole phosphatase [Muribaculaceae bacterium]|nr:alpha-ribazole phosphatase [Muribaculaceae bacterium]
MVRVTFVRHTSVDVPSCTCYGQSDVGLSSTFAREAEVVKSKLADREFTRVFTSPLSRCVRLAAACGYPKAEADPRLLEMNFGDWEMQVWAEITDPRLQEWFDDWQHVTPTGGESFLDQQRRVASFLQSLRLLPDGTTVLVFTHGGVLMQVMLLTGLATPDDIFTRQPTYGQLLEVEL